MWPNVNDRRLFTALLVILIALAWLALWAWGQSPYARYLNHEELEVISLPEDTVLLFVFVGGWTVMTVAMMLPTSLPLIVMFHALTRRRPDRLWLVVLLVAGYLGTWTLFGATAHLADWILHEAVEGSVWLEANAWMLGAGILVVGGVFQFTPLKYYCLDKCRSPLSFIMEHWRGRHERMHALWLGVRHGIFCIGCCWALMLLMFVVGVANIGWMLALGAVMAVEKNMPWGRRLSAPLGVLLLAWGVILVLFPMPAIGEVVAQVVARPWG
ncbi:MAG: DUF2182 domain-containing protein [Candidatus Methylomirabilales bacterium]